jgi:hypothetical protein
MRRSTWIDGVDRREKDREIYTKIASYLKCHYWYRNTRMAIERRENEWVLGFGYN